MKLGFVVLVAMVAMVAIPSLANADSICGKLTGYCGNGWCNKFITPTHCLNGGDTCQDGAWVKIAAENPEAMTELNRYLDDGEGARVCATGALDPSGVFQVSSVTKDN